jgi:hypothetical protein
MLAGIHAGMRSVRGVGHMTAAVAGRIIGGSDYRSNQKKGVGMGDNINASIHSARNQHVVNNGKGGGNGGDKKPTAGQTAARIAGSVGRLATLPIGIMKDLVQGGTITAGKNLWPRMRNVAMGRGVFNRADVVRKHAEKSTEASTEKTDTTTTTGGTTGTPPPTGGT